VATGMAELLVGAGVLAEREGDHDTRLPSREGHASGDDRVSENAAAVGHEAAGRAEDPAGVSGSRWDTIGATASRGGDVVTTDGGIGCGGHDDLRIARQVVQLEDGTLDEKTEAALVLGVLAATGPEKQACIVRAGAVAQLVELLRVALPEARGQAAVALRALASNSTYNKVAIVRAGAIQPLIQILKQDEVDVQEVAAGALETLAETNSQVEIVQAGAIVSLVALLHDDRPKAREEAAGAFAVLAQSAAARAAIAQVGAIPLLVDLLRDEVAEVRVQAAAALKHLAAEDVDDPLGTRVWREANLLGFNP